MWKSDGKNWYFMGRTDDEVADTEAEFNKYKETHKDADFYVWYRANQHDGITVDGLIQGVESAWDAGSDAVDKGAGVIVDVVKDIPANFEKLKGHPDAGRAGEGRSVVKEASLTIKVKGSVGELSGTIETGTNSKYENDVRFVASITIAAKLTDFGVTTIDDLAKNPGKLKSFFSKNIKDNFLAGGGATKVKPSLDVGVTVKINESKQKYKVEMEVMDGVVMEVYIDNATSLNVLGFNVSKSYTSGDLRFSVSKPGFKFSNGSTLKIKFKYKSSYFSVSSGNKLIYSKPKE